MLSDQTALVTGGASGIGRGICRTLADYGADIVVADVRERPREGGKTTVEVVEGETDATAKYVECDVATPDDIAVAIEATESLGSLDIMVNNAAIAQAVDAEVDEARYDRIMDVNLKGVFFGTRLAGERMRDADGGSIVNIASVEGVRAVAPRPVYSASRGAVSLLTGSFAGYFGDDDVRVNTIHPGAFETAMSTDDIPLMNAEMREAILQQTPLGRVGDVAEVGKAVVFFASDLSSYVTGTSLPVDGGQCATF